MQSLFGKDYEKLMREHAVRGENVDMKNYNLPPTDKYILNSRSTLIHVRHTYQPTTDLIVFKAHGLSAHNNQPYIGTMADEFKKANVNLITFDFSSHGYSHGRLKHLMGHNELTYISDHNHLLDDMISIVLAIYKEFKYTCPFVLFGDSLGGGISLYSGYLLQQMAKGIFENSSVATNYDTYPREFQTSVAKRFRGAALLCPLVELDMPDPSIVFILEHFVVPCFGYYQIPDLIGPPSFALEELVNPEWHAAVKNDRPKNGRNGLSANEKCCFQTGHTCVQLMRELMKIIEHVEFSFLVVHDPEDKIVPISGTHNLMQKSKTPDHLKEFLPVKKGRHVVVLNEPSITMQAVMRFIQNIQSLEKDKQTKLPRSSKKSRQSVSPQDVNFEVR